MYTIGEINNLDMTEVLKILDNVVEKYPDIVKPTFLHRPFENIDTLCSAFAEELEKLSDEEKLKILKLHPILAGLAAEKGELTAESTSEQKNAGLNTLEQDKKSKFNSMNSDYMNKFKFPFVICARENKAKVMMEQIEIRLKNNESEELKIGINEVKKICALRVRDLIKNN